MNKYNLEIIMVLMFIFVFYMIVYKKENFNIEIDQRCKKKGQVFSDFMPGTICIGPGKVKII
jgi:hypothetical protein